MAKPNKTLVAISALATAGKDTFCNILCEELMAQGIGAKRYALADELKSKVRKPLKDLSGIDIFKCTPKEKELVRDYLVAVGKIKRFQSEGKYWTGLLEEQINSDKDIVVPVVTDVRYDVFPEDEVWWATKHMHGVLVHLSRYEVLDMNDENTLFDHHHTPSSLLKINKDTGEGRLFIAPPNADEAKNDPLIKTKANYILEWSSSKDATNPEVLRSHCLPYVTEFIKYLKRYKLKS